MVNDGEMNETTKKSKEKDSDGLKTVHNEKEIILGNNKHGKQSEDGLYVYDLFYV